MKKVTVLLFCAGLIICNISTAQCKFKSIKKYAKFAKSEDCSIKVDIATKPKVLFDKSLPVNKAYASFVKSGEDFYLFFLLQKGYSSKFEIRENNSLDLVFDGNEPLSLFPCGNFKGKTPIGTIYNIGCFYKITKEQIKQIAGNDAVDMILLHFTSDKKLSGEMIDEDGSTFFEYKIHSASFADNAPKAATCILTK